MIDEKQRQLQQFVASLRDPAPPPQPATLSPFESVTIPSPVAPPLITPESVQHMLESQREQQLAGADGDAQPQPVPFGLTFGPAEAEAEVSDELIEIGVRATEKLQNQQPLSAEELSVFEAIILPGKRPVLDIRDGSFSEPPVGWEFLNEHRAVLNPLLPAIGRIDIPELITVPYAGTGFFVGDGLLMTNRHVAMLLVDGVGAGPRYLRFKADYSARFNPRYEVGDPDEGNPAFNFQIVETLLVHPHWDAALFRVRPVGNAVLPPGLRLARSQPADFGKGVFQNIAVVGYPMLDTRNNVNQQLQIFRQIFGRKRLMPGYLTGYSEQQVRWGATLHAATHDASTLGGNSGSAVIDLSSGLVLALHFGGKYLVANYGVPGWELAQDQRVVELGVSFADLPGPPATDHTASSNGATTPPAWLDAWQRVTALADRGSPTARESRSAASSTDGKPRPELLLPVAADWFEYTHAAELLAAMRSNAAQTELLIRATLYPAEAEDLLKDLQQQLAASDALNTAQRAPEQTASGQVDPWLPEIIFVPGFAGSHLSVQGSQHERVWLSPLAFSAGQVTRQIPILNEAEQLPGARTPLSPDGHVRLLYEKAARKWRMHGFVVHEFCYDWRASLTQAAEQLHSFIETLRLERAARRLALVAHSSGGLLAALYATRYPQWSRNVVQAILLGTPLRGCYVPVELLLESEELLTGEQSEHQELLRTYLAALRGLPGLLDLLPDPELFPDAADLYQRAAWPRHRAPAQIQLDQSRQLKRLVATSPLLASAQLIVSASHPTTGALQILEGRLRAGPRNQPGDGSVPIRSAAGLNSASVYRASARHAQLPRETAVIDAVEQLLKEGRCDLPRLSRRQIEDSSRIAEDNLDRGFDADEAAGFAPLQATVFTQQDADFFLRLDWSAQ